ncbi:hypothetical protein PybrP1_008024 [[Pythium] brassicae (nom. inval.)]|nr:hypothetical protein PybrP1_008024 [[Pythium] brassicae (nom. inval.)]
MALDWDATVALVRWRQARRDAAADARLVATGLALFMPPFASLDAAARALNVSWPRLASEAAQLAVQLLTRARRGDSDDHTAALRLLRRALDAFAARGESDALALPTNASNLLLGAVADVLEKPQGDRDEHDALLDVKRVLLYLFGMQSADTVVPTFQLYKPPTNVFSEFMHRALTAAVARLASDERRVALPDDVEREYVAVIRAVVVVYQELQRSQMNKRKVFLAVAKTSLRELIGYRHALVQLAVRGVAGVAPVVQLLDRIVVDALFDAEHIRDFDSAMVHKRIWRHADGLESVGTGDAAAAEHDDGGGSKSKKKRRKNDGVSALVSYQKNLFDELKAFLSDPAVALALKSSVGGFMQVLVGAFAVRIRAAAHSKIEDTKTDLKTSKKRAATVIAMASTTYSPFKFWSELCAVSFLAFKQLAAAGDAGADALALLVMLYKSLFEVLCDADIYRVTEDTDEREQFEAMETILTAFVNLVNRSVRSGGSRLPPPTPLAGVQEQCQIVSSAVRCSPNLVNSSLVPIFEILGRHVLASNAQQSSASDAVLAAGSSCLVDLVRSYESMRLLDRFLRASMATTPASQASEGLYALFSHPLTESALRRAFRTLPPGQLEVLWTLLTDELAAKHAASSSSGSEGLFAVGLVRFMFQIFLQEVHVTPQNKAKVAALTATTHAALFAPLVPRLAAAAAASKTLSISGEDRELFGLFGELLSFYDVVADTQSETFDVVLSALKQRSVTGAMRALLDATPPTSRDRQRPASQSRRLDSGGVIKVCVFWLRKAASVRYAPSDIVSVREADLLSIALLVVDHVIERRCWDAVAFYLPELLDVVSERKAAQLLNELVRAYLSEESGAVADGPATRIVREAAFYEIRTFRAVAPAVLAALVAEFSVDASASLESARHVFAFLQSLPDAYLESSGCGDLLVNGLELYEIVTSTKAADNEQSTKLLAVLLGWLQTHFKRIALAAAAASESDVRRKVDAGVRFVFLQAAKHGADSGITATLLGDMLSFYLDELVGSDEFVGELFASLVLPHATAAANLSRSALAVEALAGLRLSGGKAVAARKVTYEERAFIGTLVSLLTQAGALDDSTAFVVLGALVKYQATVEPKHAKPSGSGADQEQQLQLQLALSCHVGAALANAMKVVVSDVRPAEAWQFFTGFCQHFAAFRPSVTLETFGCLLAVALALVSKTGLTDAESAQAVAALQAIVANASKDEFRLLLATVSKEVSAPECGRAVSALKALSLVLQSDRKLSPARRESLSHHKDAIVGALVHNFNRSLASATAPDGAELAELCASNLQAFVLLFTKAELFAWKPHELAHIFVGFQPLLAVAAHWGRHSFSAPQVHRVWMLSYTLLLRIVRHHFASLVNGTPHLVQVANALLELLVVASNASSGDGDDGDRDGRAAQFAEWGSNLARLYGYMKEHDAQLRKHVVYLMLSYLVGVTRDNLSVELQQKLRPGVFALLDICSLFEKEQLYAALDSTGKSLLKSLDTSYKLTHRYAGKV